MLDRGKPPSRACTLIVAALLAACAPDSEAELLEVHGVTPDRLEPGHLLEVRGAGFPAGRAARVRLEGRFVRPGSGSREVRVELRGRAISSEQIEARLTDGALDALGGRGTLHGTVTVVFDAAEHGAVIGRSRVVTLDVVPAGTEHLAAALSRARRAALLATQLGLALGEESPDVPGLPVEAVEEGSPAARAGVVAGDRVVAIDGVRVHALSDLMPPPGAARATLELARAGEASTFEARMPLIGGREELSSRELHAAQAAFAWALVILLLFAPSAALLDWITARPAPAPRPRRSLTALRVSIALASFACVVTVDAAGLLHVPLELVLALVLAARAGAACVGPASRWERLRAIAGAAASTLLAGVALGAAAALAGTSDLAALSALGGAAPWEWRALATPAGPLLVLLLIAAGAWRARSRLALVLEEGSTLALAAVTAAVLLGGWSAPFEGGLGRVLGAALYVTSGLACWTAMRKLGAVRPRRLSLSAAAAAAAAVATTAAWIAHEPPPIEAALAETLTVVLAVTGAVLAYRRVSAGAAREPAPALPFL